MPPTRPTTAAPSRERTNILVTMDTVLDSSEHLAPLTGREVVATKYQRKSIRVWKKSNETFEGKLL